MPTIASVPASFSIVFLFPQAVTFAIPTGVYTSGVWEVSETSLAGPLRNETAATAGGSAAFPSHVGGPVTLQTAVTAAQLVDINLAAGGSLAASLDTTFASAVAVTSFTLTIVTAEGRRRRISGKIRRFPFMLLQVLTPITVRQDVSSQMFPMGYQTDLNVMADIVQYLPGLFNFANVANNGNVGVRIYSGLYFKPNAWNYGSSPPDNALITSISDVPFDFRLGRRLVVYVEFYSITSAAPANSSIEFSLLPRIER